MKLPTERDRIYLDPRNEINEFAFDDSVARVFPDMLKRSVPGYGTLISMIGVLANQYIKPDSNIYDLGSSLGAATLAVQQNIQYDNCTIYAVDSSEDMIERSKDIFKESQNTARIIPLYSDIRDVEIHNASMVILNLTLMFIDKEEREGLLKKIKKGMIPGGVIVLSEKIKFEDAFKQKEFKTIHENFKQMNGYSEMEISQKRTAIENYLVSDSPNEHLERLSNAGFMNSQMWFQCLSFASFIAWS
jgi:tRNA (cmo5U34)-methyltransferase